MKKISYFGLALLMAISLSFSYSCAKKGDEPTQKETSVEGQERGESPDAGEVAAEKEVKKDVGQGEEEEDAGPGESLIRSIMNLFLFD